LWYRGSSGTSSNAKTIARLVSTPSRIEALRMYASGSAWFAHDDAQCGTLAFGKFAGLAALSKDYLHVPVEEIGGIQSLLTMVGGRVVYADGPFTKSEQRR